MEACRQLALWTPPAYVHWRACTTADLVLSRPRMRRRTTRTADELWSLLRALLYLRANDRNRLPGYAEPILVFLGTRPDGSARLRELRERLSLGQSRASRLCAALARAGLVEVVTPAEDRRASRIRLTPQGSRLVGRAAQAIRAGVRRSR